ncbi:hypothetical protein P4C99_07205 [Pontiellaceae bacterium B1224]|nr:hypothetical protein [Pontiellaceae bacterium B1224]
MILTEYGRLMMVDIRSPHKNKFTVLKIFTTEIPIFGTPETDLLGVGKYSDSQPK